MRVICPFCSEKAVISSTNSLNDNKTISDLYCSCQNVKTCGATFVYSLSYSHVLNPPARTAAEIALGLISRLSREEKVELQRVMGF
jgi:cell division protein ZapA